MTPEIYGLLKEAFKVNMKQTEISEISFRHTKADSFQRGRKKIWKVSDIK
jgi:hypothetical protein